MKYRCPSCHISWEDQKHPQDLLTHPLCHFCSLSHDQKELLNWQMEHLSAIPPEFQSKVLYHFYRFVEEKLKLLQRQIDEHAGNEADE